MKKQRLVGAFIIFLTSFLTAFAAYLVKLGVREGSLLAWGTVLGVVLYVVSFVALLAALRFGEVSELYPLFSFTYVWSLALAYKYLGEPVSLANAGGVLLITSGVFLNQKGWG